MNKVWTDDAWEDYIYWQKQDKKTLERINKLIKSIDRNSFDSIGKPEPMKYDMQGYWSVRIDKENRLVYKVEDDNLYIVGCRHHYNN